MSLNPDIRDQAYQFFIEEAQELLQVLEIGLLNLKKDYGTAKIHELMRAAHSIKGGAASVELEAIKVLAHRLEDFFKALYSDKVEFDDELEGLLLQAYDRLRNPLIEQIETGSFDGETALLSAESVFASLEEKLGDALTQTDNYIPSSTELGVDIVASIFEVDVAESIARLQDVLIHSHNYEVAEELRSLAEVFAGFGELLNLPGFTKIAQTALQALELHGERTLEIVELLLEDCQSAREAVLAGDRACGGEPSAALMALANYTSPETATELDAIEEPLWAESNLTAELPSLDDLFGSQMDVPVTTEMSSETIAEPEPQLESSSVEVDPANPAYQFFIEEAQELLQTIEEGLLHLREDCSTPKVHELMRAAHSIKGGAASVGLEAIKTLAHRLEDFLKALYSDSVDFTSELEELLLQAYDCLRSPLTEQIETGTHDADAALSAAQPIFAALEKLLGDALLKADDYIPSSSDLGIDIASSIFEIDVAQGIDNLTQAIANADNTDIIAEVRAQAEVFAGFAELLNLPGFTQIVATTLTALEMHPERGVEIAQLMLADCRSAREAVLAGDRDRGGEPSAALLAIAEAEALSSSPPMDDSVADIFGSPLEPLPDLTPVKTTNIQSPPSLDDFGVVDNNSFEAITEVSQDSQDPSLEDIFSMPSADAESEREETQETLAAPQNLETAIESIEEIFADLPPVNEASTFSPTSVKSSQPTAKKATSRPPQQPTSGNLTVRVDLSRLERMNNLIGELTINRNSLSLQNEQLQSNVQQVLQRFAHFRAITTKVRDLSDRLLVEGQRPQAKKGSRQVPVLRRGLLLEGEFDSLEMDRYGEIHFLLQEILEEIMQLEEGVDDIALFAQQSDRTIKQQKQMLTQMRNELMWARMLPLDRILQRFPRVLRDLSSQYNKPVGLEMHGTEVLVDKGVLEKLYDPLLHLLRNGFDHGIEPPEIRRQLGKPEKGQITISAYYRGNQTIIEIKDDGQGLNFQKIAKKAVKNGLIASEQIGQMSKEKLLDLIFEPGFSTAKQVSEISGRGVGLNIVRSQLNALKGTVTVNSAQGKGTTFILSLPLTLTIAKLLVFALSSTALALPSDSIEEIIIPEAEQIKSFGEQRFLFWQQQLIPIYSLNRLLHYNCYVTSQMPSQMQTVSTPEDWGLPLLLLRQGQQQFALEVQRLITEQELVIKPFGRAIAPPKYTYGCTIMGDGTVIPVINGSVLLEEILDSGGSGYSSKATTEAKFGADEQDDTILGADSNASSSYSVKTILVVDDSTALRRTMALSLEKQGYRVLQARDGKEALTQLSKHAQVNLVICDVEMPNMNGFEFLGMRRRDSTLKQIPVVMLTSRSGNKHRQLAKQLGANDYFTKPYIEQEFVVAIRKLI